MDARGHDRLSIIYLPFTIEEEEEEEGEVTFCEGDEDVSAEKGKEGRGAVSCLCLNKHGLLLLFVDIISQVREM